MLWFTFSVFYAALPSRNTRRRLASWTRAPLRDIYALCVHCEHPWRRNDWRFICTWGAIGSQIQSLPPGQLTFPNLSTLRLLEITKEGSEAEQDYNVDLFAGPKLQTFVMDFISPYTIDYLVRSLSDLLPDIRKLEINQSQ